MYLGKVHLVLASDVNLDGDANKMKYMDCIKGWQRFTPNLVPWRASGNHITVLKTPHVTELSARLSESIPEEP